MMGNDINWIITILYRDKLLRCALKIPEGIISNDCKQYPMEPENREIIHDLLPLHVKSCGKIMEIEKIFEIHIISNQKAGEK